MSSPAIRCSPTKDKPARFDRRRARLGVRFIVEGSVRRTGDQIRLNAQLIDTATGDNLWANRFDRGIADVFAVQDEMSREIAKALGVQASAAESERMARPPTHNLEAYDYYLRAEQAARTGRRAGLREALALYDKAEELDPAFAEAFAADARTTVYIWRASFDDIIQSALARKRAYEKASRALELDPDLSSPYAILGIMQVVDRRYEEAIASAQRAVALGPGDAEAQIALGYVQLFAGNHAEAAAAVETALKLDPNLSAIDREVAGLVFLLQGNTAKAIETLERTRDDAPGSRRFSDYARCGLCPRRPFGGCTSGNRRGLRLTRGPNPARLRSLAAWRHHLPIFATLRIWLLSSTPCARQACPNGRSASPPTNRPVERRGDRVSRSWPYIARPTRTRPATGHHADRTAMARRLSAR